MWKPLLAGAVALAAGATACSSGSVSKSGLTVGVENPPPPPRGALVLGGETGSRAVALAVTPRRLTATVLSPDGGPLSGLKVTFVAGSHVVQAHPCGPGCYSAGAPRVSRVVVRPSGSNPVVFLVPA